MYKVERGIQMPDEDRGRKTIYPFGEMEKGDSFRFPFEKRLSVQNSCISYGRKHKMKFAVRRINKKECGCWRIK